MYNSSMHMATLRNACPTNSSGQPGGQRHIVLRPE